MAAANMEAEKFEKEINKYKVVRGRDHHKVRDRKRTVQGGVKAITPPAAPAAAPRPAVRQAGGFWALIESTIASSGVLTPSEISIFIDKLKKEHEQVWRQTNLDDLNALVAGKEK